LEYNAPAGIGAFAPEEGSLLPESGRLLGATTAPSAESEVAQQLPEPWL